MAVELTKKTISGLKHEAFKTYLGRLGSSSNDKVTARVELEDLPLDAVNELATYAKENSDRGLARVVKVFLAARSGDFTHGIPRLMGSDGIIRRYLESDMIDGWIYVEDKSGNLNPELVTEIGIGTEKYGDGTKFLAITTVSSSINEDRDGRKPVSPSRNVHKFYADNVINKTAPDILASAGILKETPELRADYEENLARHTSEIMTGFASQFLFTGSAVKTDRSRDLGTKVAERKVIVDLEQSDYGPLVAYDGSIMFDDHRKESGGAPGTGLIPYATVVKVFDLKTYDFYWVNSRDLVSYVYDEKLASKLVMPDTHRGLLDVLTGDLESFTGDIIKGKSTGNVILCAGISGVGKTLTAEVYSETMRLPLYTIHSGNLGTTAEAIQKGLSVIFTRAKRWGCVLLLDEADVFVMARGNSVENNAIVAEFLRTMEYFDGLLFMTTNRSDDIDDAILSRCLAIIRYAAPSTKDARLLWKITSEGLGQRLADGIVEELVAVFPEATGRDMKQLCGTVFRTVKAGLWTLDVDTFRRAAMFRGVDMARNRGKGAVAGVEDAEIASHILEVQDRLEEEMGFRPSPADAMKYLVKLASAKAA